MSQSNPPFSMLDEATIAAAELRRDPYDFAFVEQALSPRFKDEVLADAPEIPDRGSYGLPSRRRFCVFWESAGQVPVWENPPRSIWKSSR